MNLVFDIGFNRGEFSKVCIEKNPDCKIVGVEANPSLYYDFEQSSNIKLLHRLVSDGKEDAVDFYIDPSQDGISTASQDFMESSRFSKGSKYLAKNSATWYRVGKVKTITLDEMVKEYGHPDIIKIDVEGYEHKVISGLTEKAGKICFECHEEEIDKLYKVVDHLMGLGYSSFGMIGYYEEGDIFEKLTYSEHGDPYMVEPDNYYSWEEIKSDFSKCFSPDRRINYGMVWVK